MRDKIYVAEKSFTHYMNKIKEDVDFVSNSSKK